MREILFNELTAVDKRKRSLSIHEAFEQSGYIYKIERKAIFRVKDAVSFKDPKSAICWVRKKIKEPDEARRLSVFKVYDSNADIRLWRSRSTGVIYLVRGNAVMTLLFLQLFKLGISRNA